MLINGAGCIATMQPDSTVSFAVSFLLFGVASGRVNMQSKDD
jgi:hypothetical protein